MRVLLAPQEIAGYMSKLKSGLLECGNDVRFYDLTTSYAQYGGDNSHPSIVALKKGYQCLKTFPNIYRRLLLFPLELVARLTLFLKALIWADVIIFGFASSYLWGLDLPFYRLANKRIILIYFGSDSRPIYLNGKFIYGEGAISIRRIRKLVARQKKKIIWFDKYSDLIVDHPPTAQFHERDFVPFLYIGLPSISINLENKMKDKKIGRTIVHAPSSPVCKGTENIRNMIINSKNKYNINYIELIGKKNKEVIDCLSVSDFVVDEVYSDSLLAGLGTEAATLGVPTLISGYTNNEDYGIENELLPPAFSSSPDKLEEVFNWMLENPEEVEKKGCLAKKFVTEKWSSRSIANRLLYVLNNSKEKCYSPSSIQYFMGWGISEQRLRKFLSQYIKRYGIKALYLDDKPRLVENILDFIRV